MNCIAKAGDLRKNEKEEEEITDAGGGASIFPKLQFYNSNLHRAHRNRTIHSKMDLKASICLQIKTIEIAVS